MSSGPVRPRDLPAGWVWTTLEEILIHLRNGISVKPDAVRGLPILKISAVRPDALNLAEMRYLDAGVADYRDFVLMPGDLLFTRYNGTPELVGVCAVVPTMSQETVYPDKLIRVRLASDIDPSFICHAANVGESRAFIAQRIRTTAGQAGISGGDLRNIPLPLAPQGEQRRIVAEIDALLTDLDAAVGALKRVQANLKRYRASVLKAACEGRLVPTEAELARKEGRTYETGEQILARILKERRAKWQADQLANMLAAGKPPNNDDWKKKYKEPERPDTGNLPELPEGWAWGTMDEIAETVGGITKGQKRKETGLLRSVPYLRVANVQRGFLDLSEIKEIEATEAEIRELTLQKDDILFNEGGDRDKLGRGWIWEGQIAECIHQNHVYRARLVLREVEPEFVSHFANSAGQRYFLDEGKQTTNLASINLTKLRAFPVPLPPSAEQRRIVEELQRQLDYIAATESCCRASQVRADRLRQAILKRAFEGKLVPQNPNDEPASVLLERIGAERAAKTSTAAGLGGKRRVRIRSSKKEATC